MKLFTALAFACAVAQALPKTEQGDWITFKAIHSKTYNTPDEEGYRMKVFLENKQKVEEHNERYRQGLVSYSLAVNHLADLTPEEVKQRLNGFRPEMKVPGVPYVYNGGDVPETVDWRTKGAVTDVKNQRQCGSCWAFSVTGSLEGQHFLKTGKLVSLSEQQLVDCPNNTFGCFGGLVDQGFIYIRDNGGIESEDSYPYEAVDKTCRFKKEKVVATISGYVDIPSGDEEALMKAVATVGPISVGIDASLRTFHFYDSGVYSDSDCSNDLDHGVLVVGYGNEDGKDYWLVKNTWGSFWGDRGYIKMARNQNNLCGIASLCSYPTV